MNDFNDLQWFLLVLKYKSFSAAADQLDVSKSVVSKYISRLEKNLGVKLLNRTTRKLSLTEAGQLVYQRAMNINEEFEQIKQLAKTHSDVAEGTLRINAPFGFGQNNLVPAVAKFMKKHPKIHIELLLGSYLAALVNEGIDLAIFLKQPTNPNLIIRKIMNYKVYFCASPLYLKKYGTPTKIDDLLQHNCLTYKSLTHTRPWYFIDKEGKEIERMVHGDFSANSSRALLKAALNNIGIVKLASHIVEDYIENGQLVSLLNCYSQNERSVYIARAETSYLPKKTRLFIDFIADYFK